MTKAIFHLRQFRLLLLVLLCALFSLPLSAQKAYVEKSKDETTLTFYYDNNRSSRNGKTWGIDENIYNFFGSRVSAWAGTYYSPNEVVTKVVFDASFQNFHPTTTNSWFYNLKALTTIEGLKNLNTSAVTNMGSMFYGCSGLKELNVSNFNTSAVTDMRSMFSGCSDLRSLNLSNFNTAAVTNMSGMFRSCSGLTVLNLSNFNTSTVTDMSSMFSGCSSLTELNVSNFNTSAVTNMYSMFSGCSGLTALNLSNFNTSTVTDMSSMFSRCSGLKTIFNTNTWRCKKSQDMFEGCIQLKGAVKYDASKLDVTMANPTTGYFADPRPKAYVLQSEDKQTLTFFYDAKSTLRSGKTWGINENIYNFFGSRVSAWAGTYYSPNEVVTKVVFDASFQNFHPTTTNSWFYNLKALTTIEGLENLNTSAVTDMSEMFRGCSGLTSLNLSKFNTSAVTDMGEMFYGCSGLKSLNLSNFNTSAVTDMSEMFSDCSSLKSLNLSNFNTSAVTKTNYMFSKCSSLTSLNLSNFNTSKVTDMSEMFSGCSSLKELNVSNNTSAVTNMSRMFSGCSGLTSLSLSNFNTSKVTDMSEMFYNCSSLKTIYSANTWRCENSKNMFEGCIQLRGTVKYDANKLDVKMANPQTGYFYDSNPKAYVLQSEDQQTLTFFYDANYILRSGKIWYIDELGSSLVPEWAGTTDSRNQTIKKAVFDVSFKNFRPTTTKDWFYNLSALTTIEGFENLNTSSVTNMREMFSGCSGLKELNLSNFNTSKVTDMYGMFSGCSRLTSLNLSNFNTAAVTDMSDMFSGCSGLKELNLSNFNTSKVTNMREMFSGCSGLKELNLSNFNTSKVTNMSWMFHGCSGLTALNLSNFNTAAVTDMNGMFSGCSGLKELNLSNFNTSKVTNMRSMFYDCSGLNTIYSANTWRCENSQDMFKGCTQLRGAVKYDKSKLDVDMANPETGYFRDPNPKAYVQQSEDLQTLTFFYDNNRYSRSSTTWGINEKSSSSTPVWAGNKVVTKVVFDASFKDFRPTTTEGWFTHLSALTTIEGLENLNTSKVTNMKEMFIRCSSLTSLNLSNLNTSAVTDMSEMFEGCSSLTSLNLSNFNTSAVTDMGYMFSGCHGLTSLNLSNFNTSAVTNMGGMFYACPSLTSLNLSNFNTSSVKTMGSMFRDCSSLTELNVSNFNTSAVKDMSWMFYGCYSLKTIFNTQTWQCWHSNGMFSGCTQLQGAVKYDKSKVDDTMANPQTGYFRDPNPKAYVQQSEDQHTLTFYYDNNRYSRSGTTWGINEKSSSSTPVWAGTYYSPDNVVTKVVFDASFKDFRPTTTYSWFSYLKALTTIEGLENLNTSKVTNMKEMFIRCSSLTSLNLSNLNTSAVTDMEGMFYGCSGLKELNISNFNTSEVTNMEGMFRGCSRLTSPNLSNFNTSKVTNMSEMFEGCSSLKELNVSNFNTSKVTNMEGMFRDCSGLKTIINTQTWRCEQSQDMFKGCTQLKGAVKYDASKLDVTMANPTTGYFTDPNRKVEAYVLQSEDQHTLTFYYDNNRKLRSGKTWDIDEKSSSSKPVWAETYSTSDKAVTKVVFDASFKDFRPTTTEGWFYHLSELTTIKGLENLNTSAVTDMSAMFFRCSGLTSLNLSNFNTSAVTNMGWMFEGCSSLTSLNVSNFNTSKVTNMSEMFEGCSSLKELNVSNFNTSAVTNMGQMFYGCSGLKELNVSNFNTSAVTDMSQMFFGSSGLTALNLSNFNTSAVTNMSWMFKNCSGLKELNVSNFNTSAVTNMGQMFYGCSGLKELNVSNFNTSAVINMSWMFKNCSGLKELNVSNFNTSAVTNMSDMFSGCSGLKTILNPNTWRCEQSQDMFKGCTQLKGAVKYNESKVDATMANPTTGYFSQKLPSAIGRVVFDDNNATQIYNLQGKRVNANQRHLPAGFYIVNGKKVYLNEKP